MARPRPPAPGPTERRPSSGTPIASEHATGRSGRRRLVRRAPHRDEEDHAARPARAVRRRVRRRGQPAAGRPGEAPDGTAALEAQPGRAGHRAGADAAQPGRRLGRLARAARRRASSRSSRTACSCTRCGCPPRRSRTTTRASPTARSGRSTTTSSRRRRSTGTGGRPTCGSTSASPRRSPRSRRQGATVWVQDYQLQLLPAALRELRPDLRIGFFLHIPFPPTELFMQLPWRRRIVEGLLGADLVGFHTPGGARNFRLLATRLAGAEPGPRAQRGRPYERPHGQARRVPDLHRLARSWTEMARRAGGAGAGQADPRTTSATRSGSSSASTGSTTPRASTSGCARSRSCSSRSRIDADDTVMIQLATPSRERVEHYQQMRNDIEQSVGRINGEYARVGHPVAALPAPVAAPRGAGRVLRRRRRHAGHPAARRDEPGGQGVRRLPARQRRRAGALRVRRRGASSSRTRSWSTRTTPTGSRTRCTPR